MNKTLTFPVILIVLAMNQATPVFTQVKDQGLPASPVN